jgi:probable HAF family extracellular repeat protein
MQYLGTLGSPWSEAYGVSANGAVVVGMAENAARQRRAFRWTQATGMQDLGMLPGGNGSWAWGVSADGAVVVGWGTNNSVQYRAFRWRAAGGMQDLGTLPGGNQSEAYGVSTNGVVVGRATNNTGQYRAFRWTVSNGMQDLGTLPGGIWSEAYGVSANGAVVVGRSSYYDYDSGRYHEYAFRWTASDGMQNLGTLLGGDRSVAYGVSADGSVVVGTAYDGTWPQRAFRWTASRGMEDLNVTYANLLTIGSVLMEARAISPNGRYIVGWGWNAATNRYEAFLLDTLGNTLCTLDGDVNGDGIVDDADLLEVLFNFGNQCP